MKNHPIVFIGATDFSANVLEKLVATFSVPVSAVITYSDIPHGRGGKLVPTPVKVSAKKLGLQIIEVGDDLLEERTKAKILGMNPSLGVLVAFRILPTEFISLFPKGIINLHPSLLPDLRGAAPVQWAIMLGYRESGLSTFLVGSKVDSGPILLQERFEIGDEETAGEVFYKIASLGAKLLYESVTGYLNGRLVPIEQVGKPAHLAPRVVRKDRLIKWDWDAAFLHNRVRGLSPEPSALALFAGKIVKIMRTSSPMVGEFEGGPGEIIDVSRDKILVRCGNGALWITEIQPEGKSLMTGGEFVRGYLSKSRRFEELR